jgi:seryl-tRNA synthetase
VLDLKFIRQFPDLVKQGARKKRIACDVDLILKLDEEARARGTELDRLRAEQNTLGGQVAKAPAAEKKALLERLAAIKTSHNSLDAAQREQEAELHKLLLRVPNVPADEVPEGKDDSENVEVKRWGEPRQFDFPFKDHVALAEAQGWLEIERAGRDFGLAQLRAARRPLAARGRGDALRTGRDGPARLRAAVGADARAHAR